MPLSQLPAFLSSSFADLCAALDSHSASRLFLLLCDALFARGRRTVTSWFRAAGPPTTPCGPLDAVPNAWPCTCS
jgi:hypothetical protein